MHFRFRVALLPLALSLFAGLTHSQTGIDQYKDQRAGSLEDAQVTGKLVNPKTTQTLAVKVGAGIPQFIDAKDGQEIASAANNVLNDSGRLALILVDGNKVVFEGYKSTANKDSLIMGLSMSKSVAASAVGIALCDGKIATLNDQANKYVPTLDGLSYGQATLENLLVMRGGGKSTGSTGELRPGMMREIMFQKATLADQVKEGGTGGDKPDVRFNYDNASTQSLMFTVEAATASTYQDYLVKKVLEPIEFEKAPAIFVDKTGVAMAAGGINATLRDWIRIGNLLREQWTGKYGQCLADYLKRGYSKSFDEDYGYQIRVQSQQGDKVVVRMSGFGGQYVYFNNYNSKIVATAANGANRKNLDPFVLSWMGN
jgi:CubicO group peptidase (beta-lactamase class C family)